MLLKKPKADNFSSRCQKKRKKRIDKLTRKMREAERREAAALDYAKGLQDKYEYAHKSSLNSD